MQKLVKACDVILMISLMALASYWMYEALAPAKYTYTKHTVTTGDTLYEIAMYYGKESKEDDLRKIIWDIQEANGIDNKGVGTLQPGMVLTIPIRK